jgi:hypothetical protein
MKTKEVVFQKTTIQHALFFQLSRAVFKLFGMIPATIPVQETIQYEIIINHINTSGCEHVSDAETCLLLFYMSDQFTTAERLAKTYYEIILKILNI